MRRAVEGLFHCGISTPRGLAHLPFIFDPSSFENEPGLQFLQAQLQTDWISVRIEKTFHAAVEHSQLLLGSLTYLSEGRRLVSQNALAEQGNEEIFVAGSGGNIAAARDVKRI